MCDIELRPAKPEDAAALAALAYATFRETFLEGFAIPYPPEDLAAFVETAYAADAFARRLTDPLLATWIAERAGAPVGYASAGPCGLPHPDARPEQGELHRLYVLSAAQGRGLGRQMMEAALAWMQAHRPGPVWIGVWSGNLKAQRMYAAYGFRKVGDYQFPVGRWRDAEFILRRY